jgi:hypothetical protein
LMKDATAMDVEIEQQDIFNTQIHGFMQGISPTLSTCLWICPVKSSLSQTFIFITRKTAMQFNTLKRRRS